MEGQQTRSGLEAGALCPRFDLSELAFETTHDLARLDGWLGQERAIEAIRLAATMPHHDFNLFVLGRPGVGRHSATKALLEAVGSDRPQAPDWVYVNNFSDPQKPVALRLPTGMARGLKRAMETLIDDLANDLPALFEADDYQTRRRAIEQTYADKHEAEMDALMARARERGVTILRTPMGLAVTPVRDGEVISPDAFRDLPEPERAAIEETVAQTQDELKAVLRNMPKFQKAQREEVEQLNFGRAAQSVDAAIAEHLGAFRTVPKIDTYVATVRADLIANAEIFLGDQNGPRAGAFPIATTKHYEKPVFQRYMVNVIVSNDPREVKGAPFVVVDLPSLANLIGRIEHVSQFGALVTNFTMIKPGALHRANGGFLVLDARQVLAEPFAWDALKRALSAREISVFSASERFSLVSTISLEPDPIPLDIRVILIGERRLYYLLAELDPDFARLFKLQADFSDETERDARAVELYARLIASIAHKENLRPLDRSGVARVLAESTRIAGDAARLSLNLGLLSDMLREADFHAGEAGQPAIRAQDFERAIAARDTRAGRIEDLTHTAILRRTVLIDTQGARIGQINGLSVFDIGGHRFGRPSRITTRVRLGTGKLVDIERETELGGPLHSKGVMILQGYLATQYAVDMPLSLWASIVFEQSYGGIEGDSASAAELLALLSALAELPLDQALAVTGSVNQFGDIQAIGGVNEKIEGFFDICAARGLTGRQGVLIPDTNVKNLALRPRVVDAVEKGRFRIQPVQSIAEAVTHVLATDFGERDRDGVFPEGSVNRRVEERLRAFAHARKSFAVPPHAAGDRS